MNRVIHMKDTYLKLPLISMKGKMKAKTVLVTVKVLIAVEITLNLGKRVVVKTLFLLHLHNKVMYMVRLFKAKWLLLQINLGKCIIVL